MLEKNIAWPLEWSRSYRSLFSKVKDDSREKYLLEHACGDRLKHLKKPKSVSEMYLTKYLPYFSLPAQWVGSTH